MSGGVCGVLLLITLASAAPPLSSRSAASLLASSSETIPRLMWTFWNLVDPPPPYDAFIARRAKFNSAWEDSTPGSGPAWSFTQLHLGHDMILTGELEPPPVDGLSLPHLADWYRLVAITRFGGVWMDADTISFGGVERWVDMSSQALMQGFSVEGTFEAKIQLQAQNWAIAAPAGSAFTRAWLDEYRHALTIGGLNWLNLTSTRTFLLNQPVAPWESNTLLYFLQMACWVVVRKRDFPTADVSITSPVGVIGRPFWLYDYCIFVKGTPPDIQANATSQCFVDSLFSLPQSAFHNTSFVKLNHVLMGMMETLPEYKARGSWLAAELLDGMPKGLEKVGAGTDLSPPPPPAASPPPAP